MLCVICGWEETTEPMCDRCMRWAMSQGREEVIAEIVKNRAKNEYTPGATDYKLQYWARIKSRKNNRILMDSEMYVRKRSAVRCLELLGFTSWRDVDEQS